MKGDSYSSGYTEFKDFAAQKAGCSDCVGYIKDCKYCGAKIEILEGKVLDYHAGSAHRCHGGY
jgi:hypothetical protein